MNKNIKIPVNFTHIYIFIYTILNIFLYCECQSNFHDYNSDEKKIIQ